MIINHNLQAMNTHRQLGIANTGSAKSMEKLSSGYRINRAGDDAAGLAISEKMRGQIRGLGQASRNAQDGISLIQTAEGALDETHAILQRMRELAVQSSTDTNTSADRLNIQDEIDQLAQEITRISETTEFNTMGLLDGTFKDKKFHIGANQGQDIGLEIENMGSVKLGIGHMAVEGKADLGDLKLTANLASNAEGTATALAVVTTAASGTTSATVKIGDADAVDIADFAALKDVLAENGISVSGSLEDGKIVASTASIAAAGASADDVQIVGTNVTSQANASKAITTFNDALETVSKERSKLGAVQNRLEHTIKNLDTSAENLQASEARIRDVDMAKEMMEQTKQNILQQASTAMLAQANQAPQNVLQLLR